MTTDPDPNRNPSGNPNPNRNPNRNPTPTPIQVEKHKKSYLDFVPDEEMAQKISDAADEDMCA